MIVWRTRSQLSFWGQRLRHAIGIDVGIGIGIDVGIDITIHIDIGVDGDVVDMMKRRQGRIREMRLP